MSDKIVDSISSAIDNINLDKKRLNGIINAINAGTTGNVINDRLIDNLTNLDTVEENFDLAIEFLAIILSNMESQKVSTNKQMTEELIKILEHNLELLKNLESCIGFFNEKTSDSVSYKKIDTNKEVKKEDNLWLIKTMLPKTNLANSIMWILFLLIVFVSIRAYDNEAVNDFGTITEKVLHINKGDTKNEK